MYYVTHNDKFIGYVRKTSVNSWVYSFYWDPDGWIGKYSSKKAAQKALIDHGMKIYTTLKMAYDQKGGA